MHMYNFNCSLDLYNHQNMQRQQVLSNGYNDVEDQTLIAYPIGKAGSAPWHLNPSLAQGLDKVYSNVLKELSWSACGLGNDVLLPLARALDDNTSVTVLDISNNNLNPGVSSLVEALKKNSNITRLNLQGNTIGADGVTAIFEGLLQAKSSCIEELDLSCNNVGDGVWDPALFSVAQLLEQGCQLKKLYLPGNWYKKACTWSIKTSIYFLFKSV